MSIVGERTRRNVSFVAQWVVILGAILAVLGWSGGFVGSWLDDSIDERNSKQIEDPQTKAGGSEPAVLCELDRRRRVEGRSDFR